MDLPDRIDPDSNSQKIQEIREENAIKDDKNEKNSEKGKGKCNRCLVF